MGKTYLETTKYLVLANFEIEGLVERPDVIGAIFGQSEGLLGANLDIKELQQNGKIGRIEASIKHVKNRTLGELKLPCSLTMVETTIIAAAIETIEKVGPCDSKFIIRKIEDTRDQKRKHIKERAIDLLGKLMREQIPDTRELMEEIMDTFKTKEIINYGPDKLAAGPSIKTSKDIIIVEGRADVINLLRYGFTNTISTGGARIPKSLENICKSKNVTIFLDGDRGGDIQQSQLMNVIKIDYVARAPDGKEVEELTQKEINQALRKKIKASNLKNRKDNSKSKEHIVNKFSTTYEHKIVKENLENTKRFVRRDRTPSFKSQSDSNYGKDTKHKTSDVDLEHMLSGISNIEKIDIRRSPSNFRSGRSSFNNSRNNSRFPHAYNSNKFHSRNRITHEVKEITSMKSIVKPIVDKKVIVKPEVVKVKKDTVKSKIEDTTSVKPKKQVLPKLTETLKKNFLKIIESTKDKKSKILNEKLRRIGSYSNSGFLNKLNGFKPNKIYAVITDLELDSKLLKILKEKNVKFIVCPTSKIKEDKEINIVTHKMLK